MFSSFSPSAEAHRLVISHRLNLTVRPVAHTASSFADCSAGVLHPSSRVCCNATCGLCGGRGCSSRPGGAPQCCMPAILRTGRVCESRADVACILRGSSNYTRGDLLRGVACSMQCQNASRCAISTCGAACCDNWGTIPTRRTPKTAEAKAEHPVWFKKPVEAEHIEAIVAAEGPIAAPYANNPNHPTNNASSASSDSDESYQKLPPFVQLGFRRKACALVTGQMRLSQEFLDAFKKYVKIPYWVASEGGHIAKALLNPLDVVTVPHREMGLFQKKGGGFAHVWPIWQWWDMHNALRSNNFRRQFREQNCTILLRFRSDSILKGEINQSSFDHVQPGFLYPETDYSFYSDIRTFFRVFYHFLEISLPRCANCWLMNVTETQLKNRANSSGWLRGHDYLPRWRTRKNISESGYDCPGPRSYRWYSSERCFAYQIYMHVPTRRHRIPIWGIAGQRFSWPAPRRVRKRENGTERNVWMFGNTEIKY